jgi:hypothetical protein
MLAPEPHRRPSAAEVLDTLNGAKPSAVRMTSGKLSPDVQAKLVLQFAHFELPIGIRTRINQNLVRGIGDDMRYWDSENQFTLERRGNDWYVTPNIGARNETILNDVAIVGPTRLTNGDILGVGRAAKRILKSPAQVTLK